MAYIKHNYPIGPLTWLKVGGKVDTLFIPKNLEEILEFIKNFNDNLINRKELLKNITILGAVSNSLILDGGIPGIVIKTTSINFIKPLDNYRLEIGCGALDKTIAQYCLNNNIGGMEFLDSIPGTIGGNILTNAGCYGREIKDIVESITAINYQGEIINYESKDFQFNYRHCVLPQDLWMIYSITVKGYYDESINIKNKMITMESHRASTQPTAISTCGSTFKNPLPYKAWELIKSSGADQLSVSMVGWSHLHCNFLDNKGKSGNDIYQLIKNTQSLVKETKGVDLELEIFVYGQLSS